MNFEKYIFHIIDYICSIYTRNSYRKSIPLSLLVKITTATVNNNNIIIYYNI